MQEVLREAAELAGPLTPLTVERCHCGRELGHRGPHLGQSQRMPRKQRRLVDEPELDPVKMTDDTIRQCEAKLVRTRGEVERLEAKLTKLHTVRGQFSAAGL